MRRVRIARMQDPNGVATVRCGSWTRHAPCALPGPAEAAMAELALPADVLDELGLLPGQEVHALWDTHGRHVHLGPLVGVWLGAKEMAALGGPGDGRYRDMDREAGAAGVVPFFFGPDDVDLALGQVRVRQQREGEWIAATRPLPDVVYNRATFGEVPARRQAARQRQEMAERYGVSFLNPVNAFSKWQVYECLRFFADTAELAPESAALTDAAATADFLGRHRQVFAKANYGSHGCDVLRIRAAAGAVGAAGWQIQGRAGGQPVAEELAAPDDVHRFLTLVSGHEDWILQRGIDLPQVDGRHFDLRVIAQKDGQGLWQVPLVLVRLAQPTEVAANMSQRGTPFLPAEFRAHFGALLSGLEDIEAAVEAAARQVAVALEARFGALGEVGVDIGVDGCCQPWVFEANTKPLHPPIGGLPVPLIRFPFHYAAHLAGRKWAGRDGHLPLPVVL